MSSRVVVGVSASLLVASSLAAQSGRSTLSVGVADAQTGAPLPGAEVVLPERKLVARTDSLGQARISGVPFGEQRVRVRLLGYSPGDVRLKFAGDTTGAVFRLERAVQPLSEINVTASDVPRALKDFEQRRKQGIGRFLTEAQLTPDGDKDFMIVASMRFPGLTLRSDADGQTHLAGTRSGCGGASDPTASTTRGVDRIGGKPGLKPELGTKTEFDDKTITGSCESERPCLLQVYLDDINLGETDAGLVRTWDLSGAEYYSGNTVPARYRRSGSACGVVLLWSKWR